MTTKPVDAETAAICSKCRRQFWVSATAPPAPTACPDCYSSDHSLLRVANMAMAAHEKAEGFHGLADIAHELKTLGAPIQKRFWGPTLEQQLSEKRDAAKRVSKIARQRSKMLMSMAQLAASISSVRTAELDGQIQLLTKQRHLLKLQRQVRELEDEMRTVKVDEDHQLHAHQATPDEAAQRRARLERRQADATEFIQTIQRVFESGKNDAEMVIHIRLVLDEYGRELADLPIQVQRFLDRVEGQVHE